MLSTKRLAGAAALAFAAATVLGQTTLAANQSGQTGNYIFTDSAQDPGATCKFKQDANNPDLYWLRSITAVAPSVWWPNRDSSSNTEHGPVGWRFAVQVSLDIGKTWKTVTHSNYQKKTAYEDQPKPYDPAKAAPFTNMSVSVNARSYGQESVWRVVTRPIWYTPGGGVLGYIKHPVQHYKQVYTGGLLLSGNPFCYTVIQRS